MEQWWNDTDRGKLKYWEKNIIQHGWEMNMGMEQWWNDTDRGKLKYWERKFYQCLFVHYTSPGLVWDRNLASAMRGRRQNA